MEKTKEIFTKYERARILGARALQLSMDAPILITIEDEALSNLNYDPLRIAEIELDSGVLPISINRPLPERKDEKLKEVKIPVIIPDEKKEELENKEEKEIIEEGEIMELVTPDDEIEESSSENSSESD